MKKSDLERAFETKIKWYKLPEPVAEHRFHPTRKWRFDFAYPEIKLAIELEGGTFGVTCPQCKGRGCPACHNGRVMGRHSRGEGFEKDCEKYNAAAALGWRVLRFTGGMLKENPAACIDQVKALLNEGNESCK